MMESEKTGSFSERQLHAILDNTVEGIVVTDSSGIILSYNLACADLFGYGAEKVIGSHIRQLIIDCPITSTTCEVAGLRAHGLKFPLWLGMREVNCDGVRFFVAQLRDITAQKQHESQLKKYTEALEHSNRELDDFVYIVSHDLKEPVRGIYSYSQFLQEDYGHVLGEDGNDKLQSLIRLSKRMEDLIDRLLYFSRLNKIGMSFASMDLNKVVAEILEMLEPYLAEQKAQVFIETPLPTLVCDQARVGEIFRNLITNGIKYNERQEKHITIGVTTTHKDLPGRTVFYVKDNGIGIPEKHYESIFKMFKRLHTRDAYGGGTGAGLTIVKKIVAQHNGKIWVESQIDEGTIFYFTLEGD